jgi:1,4-dihydroxy-2-naphthoate octaprenyltransferase
MLWSFIIVYALGTAFYGVTLYFLLKHAAQKQYFKALISVASIGFAIIVGFFPILNLVFGVMFMYFIRHLYTDPTPSAPSAQPTGVEP